MMIKPFATVLIYGIRLSSRKSATVIRAKQLSSTLSLWQNGLSAGAYVYTFIHAPGVAAGKAVGYDD